MIQVSVSQDDGIQFVESTFLRQMIVILYLACTLKEAEVHEDVGLSGLQKVSGPRDFPSAGAMNCDLHIAVLVELLASSRSLMPNHLNLPGACSLKAAEVHEHGCYNHPPAKPARRRPATIAGQRRMMFQIKPVR